MVELADSLDSGSSVHYGRAGSSPARAPNQYNPNLFPIGDGFGLFVSLNVMKPPISAME